MGQRFGPVTLRPRDWRKRLVFFEMFGGVVQTHEWCRCQLLERRKFVWTKIRPRWHRGIRSPGARRSRTASLRVGGCRTRGTSYNHSPCVAPAGAPSLAEAQQHTGAPAARAFCTTAGFSYRGIGFFRARETVEKPSQRHPSSHAIERVARILAGWQIDVPVRFTCRSPSMAFNMPSRGRKRL